MPQAPRPAASRHGRDRDLVPAGPRLGPYELRYDVRRGYERAAAPASAKSPGADALSMRAREDRDDQAPRGN